MPHASVLSSLILCGQLLLGDCHYSCAANQQTADYVEDCGTDAAGAGQNGALVVLNGQLNSIIFISCIAAYAPCATGTS